MGNFLGREVEGTINIDHDPPAVVDQGLIDNVIEEASQDLRANQYLLNNAFSRVNLVKLKTREPDESPSRAMRVATGDSPYAMFDDSITDSELCNSLFLMVGFPAHNQLIQHCFITSNRNYVLYSCSDQVIASAVPGSSSENIDFTNMHLRYNHSTDDPETNDLPSNCLLHPVCYPENSISSGEDKQVLVGNGQQRLDIELLSSFDIRPMPYATS